MNSRLKTYLLTIVYPYIISKYLLLNIRELPFIDHLSVEINLQNILKENFSEILSIFLFLEALTGQRPVIKKFISKHHLRKKIYFLTLKIDLRKEFFYNFLDYLIHFIFTSFKLNNKKIAYSINKKNICFSLSNFNLFLGLPEKYKGLKCKLKLNFFFSSVNSLENVKIIKDILLNLNFFNEIFKRKK